ncbi:MAG: hypothetical protein V3V62_02340 [bacterium]
MAAGPKNRRAPRHSINLVSSSFLLKVPGLAESPLDLKDFSRSGFRVVVSKKPEVGDLFNCTLELKGARFENRQARVAWINEIGAEPGSWEVGLILDVRKDAPAGAEDLALSEEEPILLTEDEVLDLSEEEPILLTEDEVLDLSEEEPVVLLEEEPVVLSEAEPPALLEEEPAVLSEAEPPVLLEEEPVSLFTGETEPPALLEEEPAALTFTEAETGAGAHAAPDWDAPPAKRPGISLGELGVEESAETGAAAGVHAMPNWDISEAEYSSPSGGGPGSLSSGGGGGGLSKGSNPCPFLSSTEGPGMPFDRPTRGNACYAQKRKIRKGIRRVTKPFTPVSRAKQGEVCLGGFTECPHFLRASKEAEEEKASRPRPAARPPGGRGKGKKGSSHRRRRWGKPPGRVAALLRSKRLRPVVQLGSIFLATLGVSVALYIVLAANPSSWPNYVFMTIVRNNIKSFASKAGLSAEKFKSAGLPTGGGIKKLRKMSKSQLKKLKSSSKFKGLSAAQKAKLRKRFKGR